MSTEELLDVVDADDVVVGIATRTETHERGHRHRAVHILVYDVAERLYVQRRSFSKDSSPGLWDTSAAGHVESGEGYDVAAARELEEELGVVPDAPLERLFDIAASPDTGNEFVRVYRCRTDADIVPDEAEIIDGRWIAAPALNDWLQRAPAEFTTAFHRIWRNLDGRGLPAR